MNLENNTWARGDMEFLFERSSQYLTSAHQTQKEK